MNRIKTVTISFETLKFKLDDKFSVDVPISKDSGADIKLMRDVANEVMQDIIAAVNGEMMRRG